MRILVTGASGYIGRHLVPKLGEAGHYVIPLCNWPNEPHVRHYTEGPQKIWFTDLSKGFGKLTKETPPDVVIHLAGRVEISLLPNPKGTNLPPVPGPCDIGALYRDNVVATANVLNYCLKAGVKHLIFSSTQAVYGMEKEECQECGNPAQTPLEYYAASKRAAELLLKTGRTQGLMVSILRLPGVFGGDRKEGAVYNMCLDALRKREIYVAHDFPLPMNVMHIEDVVTAFVAAACWKPPNENWTDGMTVDISGRYEGCSLDRLAEEIASLVPGCKVRSGAQTHPELEIDGGPAQRMLKWHPISRKERLAQVLEEIRSGS